MADSGLIVLYGGTFDPVHNGHLAIASAAAQALDCEVRMMPAADPPHRPAPGASARQRAHMLDLAVEGRLRLRVDRRELERDGPSYTVQTLRELRSTDPDRPVALLLGADAFLGLPGWREWQALFGLAHFVVADRPGQAFRPETLPEVLAAEAAGRWTVDPAELAATPGRAGAGPGPAAARCFRHRPACPHRLGAALAAPGARPGGFLHPGLRPVPRRGRHRVFAIIPRNLHERSF